MEILCDLAQKTDELWENCVKIVGLCEKCVIRKFVRHVGILVDTLVEIALRALVTILPRSLKLLC